MIVGLTYSQLYTTDLYVFNNTINIQGKAALTGYAQIQYLDINNGDMNLNEKSAFENLTNLRLLKLFNNPMIMFLSNVFIAELRNFYPSHDSLARRESWSDLFNLTNGGSYGGPFDWTTCKTICYKIGKC